MKSHNQMVSEWMKDSSFQKDYDALEPEFALFDEILKARCRTGLTQMDIAERMGTKTPAVARLESGGGSKKRHC